MTLRAATPDDAASIGRIHADGDHLIVYGDALGPAAFARLHHEKAAMWEALLTSPPSGQRAFVVEEGDVVGFASAGPDLDSVDVGRVFAIFVERAAWGRGLGTQLLEAAQRHMQGKFANAGLWVVESNVRARRLYEHRGWQSTGADKRQHGVHFLRYEKRLSTEGRGGRLDG